MNRHSSLFFAACAAILLAACEDSENTPAAAASVVIQDVTASKREVVFTLTPENAAGYAYACLLRDVAPVETDYVKVNGGEPAAFTVSELVPGTAYTLAAWAVNSAGVRCEAVKHDFETANLPSLAIGEFSATSAVAKVTVATADAQRLFWAYAAAGGQEPAEFTEVEAIPEVTVSIQGLSAATDYVFYAYVTDADAKSETLSKKFRTADPPAVDLSAEESANCYVVSAPGTYSFRANVRGNGISSNQDEPSKHFEKEIVIGASYTADWLWASAEGLVSGVKLDKAASAIRFDASGEKGNAVIALFDGDRIVWSWHIWLTDDPSVRLISGSDAKYQFLDRNVGATSTAVDEVASFGFFYQWGRKDPFISASAVVNPTGYAIPDGEAFQTDLEGDCVLNAAHGAAWGVIGNDDSTIAAGNSVDYAAEHPMTFITYASQVGSSGVGAWVNDDNVQYAELWGYDFVNKTNQKTMFDPCPPGYKVPAWYQEVMADASKTTLAVTGDNQSRTYNDGYWPAQGYRMNNGRLSNIGKYGYYWSACSYNHGYPAQNFKGYMLYWYSRMVSNNNVQDESIGGNVRCIKQ